MATLLSAIASRLSKPDAIRKQILFHLKIAWIHNLIKSSYEQYLENSISLTQQSDVVNSARRPRAASTTQHEEEQPRIKWDWRGFPALWRYFALYNSILTIWLHYLAVRALFQDKLAALMDPLSEWLFELPGHCLVPGRLALPPAVSQQFGILIAFFYLAWHFFQARAKRNRLLTMVVFLLMSEQDLERFYYLLEDDDQNSQDTHSDVMRLLKQVMCYQVHGGGGGDDDDDPETTLTTRLPSYKLRPNRTREARCQLTRRVALVSMAIITVSVLVIAALESLVVLVILSDYRYARVYPGCYQLLDTQLAQGKLTCWPLSITLKNHHLISGLIDLIESSVILVDIILALVFVPAFCYILNYDLLLYWTTLDHKLKGMLARAIQEYDNYYNSSKNYLYLGKRAPLDVFGTSLYQPLCPFMLEQEFAPTGRVTQVATSLGRRTLERDIGELQFELYDFFHQAKRADLIVGDTLTQATLIWISVCAFANYNLLVYDASALSAIVKIVLFLGFNVVVIATYYLLELRRRCMLTYQLMCSLMAYDQAHRRTLSPLMKLLDFYQKHDSTTYHLFRAYAYKPTTFIAIIGWSFSSFFVMFTLFGERKGHNSGGGVSGGGVT